MKNPAAIAFMVLLLAIPLLCQEPPLPDLAIAIGDCPPQPLRPGQELKDSFRVIARKSGAAAVAEVAVDIVLCKSPRCLAPAPLALYSLHYSDGVLLLGGREFVTLGAGENSKPVKLNGANTVPLDTPPGAYFLCAVIDAGNRVAEADERNNCACCPVTVAAGEAVPGQPCGVRLDSLSRASGRPGDTFEMVGDWGASQGGKLACINRGRMNRLIVRRWTPRVLLVRVPDGLAAGSYKVGVYCNDPALGSTYSSGWLDFEVRPPPPRR